jgi:hypothetical protein
MTWMWNTATELFSRATQILDRFHAKEHLSQVGKAIHDEDSTERKPWIQTRPDELDEGRLKSLVPALRGQARQYPEAGECFGYPWNNRRGMRYPKFHHQQGLLTSSA